MNLFSRTFFRNRAISLATTASVAASLALSQDTSKAYHLRGAMPLQYVADRPDLAEEQPFLSANDAAMNKMLADMVIKPSGDIDRDFVAMMNPHHQGAIDMAVIELRYGKNEQLRRIAQEIIVDQMQEIAAMKLAIGEKATDTTPAPTEQQPASTPVEHHHSGMQMDMSPGMKH